MKRESLITLILFILLALIWGSAFILIKKSLLVFSPLEVGAGRIFFAFLTLLPFALRDLKKIPRNKFLLIVSSGALGSFLPAILFALAQAKVASGYAAILSGLTPVLTILVGAILFKHRTNFLQVIGVLISFSGAIFLVVQGQAFGNIAWVPSLFIALATLCYALNLNLVKFKLKEIHPLQISSISLLFMGPIALTILFFHGTVVKSSFADNWWSAAGALIVLGVTSTGIALVLFNRLLKTASPVLASSITYAIPVVALSWSIVDGEPLSINHFISLTLILGGVYLVAKKQIVK